MVINNFPLENINAISTLRYGKDIKKFSLVEKGYPVYGGNGKIGYTSQIMYEKPQILISCRGAASGKIIESDPNCFITSNSLVIELKDRYYYEFIKQYLLMNPLYDWTTGSAQPQITIDNLKQLKIPYPPRDRLKEINKVLFKLAEGVRKNLEEILFLEHLKTIILPRLLSGEIEL